MVLSRNALQIERELSYEQWEAVGAELFKVDQAWQWWVGDWINYGEKKYGQTYEQALALTDKSYGTLRNVASVCSEFELSRRRDNLSFTHHQDVASLDQYQQDAILDEAEREGKPRSWVREQVREIKGEQVIEKHKEKPREDDDLWEAIEACENKVTLAIKLLSILEKHEIDVVLNNFK